MLVPLKHWAYDRGRPGTEGQDQRVDPSQASRQYIQGGTRIRSVLPPKGEEATGWRDYKLRRSNEDDR